MMVDGKVAWVASSTTTTLNCLADALLLLESCLADPLLLLESVRTGSPAEEQVPATICKDIR